MSCTVTSMCPELSSLIRVCAQYVVSRHRTLMNVYDKAPKVDKDAFVAPSASIIGNVNVGQASSIWYGCVLRGKQECKPYLHFNAYVMPICLLSGTCKCCLKKKNVFFFTLRFFYHV